MMEYCGLARMAVSAGGEVSSRERKDILIKSKGVSIGSEGSSIESDVMLVECLVKMFGGVIWNKERRKEEQSEMKYLYVD